jgi:hypothetical protein
MMDEDNEMGIISEGIIVELNWETNWTYMQVRSIFYNSDKVLAFQSKFKDFP